MFPIFPLGSYGDSGAEKRGKYLPLGEADGVGEAPMLECVFG